MTHTEGSFTGAGKAVLFRQSWRPSDAVRAVLVNVHGLGDHGGLYPCLVEHVTERGWAVHAPDLRGNGRSPGQRAYIERWDDFRADLHAFLSLVRAEEPERPVFLLGHSLGGLVVLDYVLHHPRSVQGAIAAAPPLGRLSVPAPLLLLGRIASRILPRFALRTGMDLSSLARDPAVIEAVIRDPLFHRWGTARLSTEVVAAIARVQREAARFTTPLLLLHGGADRMVPPDGTRAFVQSAGGDVNYREYPEAYHALFADAGRDAPLGDLTRWIEARLPAPS